MTPTPTDPVPREPLDDRLSLLGWILLIVALGAAAGGFFGADAWYAGLRKPPFNPPPGVYAPVWASLYLLMAVALWLVRRERAAPAELRRRASAWFAAQFVVNLLWAPLFFGLRSPLLAALDNLLLIVVLGCTLHAFRRVRPLAAGLLLPYLAWTLFSLAVNGSVWWLNLA